MKTVCRKRLSGCGQSVYLASAGDLIAQMSRENRFWGTERIRGELLKLGIAVSNRSIRRYRWRKPTPVGSQSWRTFLSYEIKGIWAADLLVVHTINYRILYVFFFIGHDRRKLIHFNVAASPTAGWIWHQLLDATPWGRQPAYLIHDRDAFSGRDFDARTRRLGIAGVRTRPRTPKANSIAERLVGKIRRECLDHIVVINERQLLPLLAEFMDYYNKDG